MSNQVNQPQRESAEPDDELESDGTVARAPGAESAEAEEVVNEISDELSGMEQAVNEAEQEMLRHRDAMLRMQAEMDNLRKRLIRDQERARKFALEGVMKDLLQVRDSLERGLAIGPENASVESLREGEELTLRLLNKVLADHGLELIDPKGEAFNPEWHEAVAMLPSGEVPENTVLEVMQKGFRLHERLLRPAMVVVARKP